MRATPRARPAPRNRLAGWLSDRLSPLTRRLFGPEINRRTEDNVAAAGLRIIGVRRDGIWREISATPDGGAGPTSSGPGTAASGTDLGVAIAGGVRRARGDGHAAHRVDR